MATGLFLHVGCGGSPIPEWAAGHYAEVRLDLSADHNPDICASMTDMGAIGEFDVVYCSHSLEHLLPHEVPLALSEGKRGLKPGGCGIVIVPDLEGVEATEKVLYNAPCGDVTGLDLIYGRRELLPTMPHMAHRTGFVSDTLTDELLTVGFSKVETRRMAQYNLLALAVK